jgi:hypothetical protein
MLCHSVNRVFPLPWPLPIPAVAQRVSVGTNLKGSEIKGFGVSKVSLKTKAK